jgi:hypothetical protein
MGSIVASGEADVEVGSSSEEDFMSSRHNPGRSIRLRHFSRRSRQKKSLSLLVDEDDERTVWT